MAVKGKLASASDAKKYLEALHSGGVKPVPEGFLYDSLTQNVYHAEDEEEPVAPANAQPVPNTVEQPKKSSSSSTSAGSGSSGS